MNYYNIKYTSNGSVIHHCLNEKGYRSIIKDYGSIKKFILTHITYAENIEGYKSDSSPDTKVAIN